MPAYKDPEKLRRRYLKSQYRCGISDPYKHWAFKPWEYAEMFKRIGAKK